MPAPRFHRSAARAGSSRAVVQSGVRTLSVHEVELDRAAEPAEGGWLEVDACGVCGSDWAWYSRRGVAEPMILGHEIIASVRSLSSPLEARGDLVVGDRVALEEAIPCWSCSLCRSGRHRLCRSSARYGSTPLSRQPGLWGGFSEVVFLDPRASAHRVPAGLDPVLACLFIPMSNGLSWVADAGELRAGEAVLVFGPGQTGLASVAAAKRMGAGHVMVVGRTGDEHRLRAAEQLGADSVVNVDEVELGEVVDEATGGSGVDVVLDTTPMETATLDAAVALAAPGGRIVVAGAKGGRSSPLDTDTLHRSQITVRGVAARESWAVDAALGWLASDPGYFEPFGGPVVGLDEVEGALLALGGEGGEERPLHAVVVPSRRGGDAHGG